MITVTKKVFLSHGRGGRKRLVEKAPAVQQVGPGRVPRISRLMALAIKFDGLVREGKVADQSELARLAHVTQPRVTQIMNLLHLAPDIQEQLLFLPPVVDGRDPIHERMLRKVAAMTDWQMQRTAWLSISKRGGTMLVMVERGTVSRMQTHGESAVYEAKSETPAGQCEAAAEVRSQIS